MTDFLMKPKIDFAFKEIMEVEKARTGFLAAVLHLKPDDIRETRILNSHLRKAHFVLFELPKLPKELRKECSGIELWEKFINAEEREEFEMIAEKDP